VSVRSDRDSQILVLENCQTRRRFGSKRAEILVDPFEDHSAIVWNMQGIKAPEPRVAAAIGMLALAFARDRKRRPGRVPELALSPLRQIEIAKVVKSGPSTEVEHGK
jgi:hypothetical protein